MAEYVDFSLPGVRGKKDDVGVKYFHTLCGDEDFHTTSLLIYKVIYGDLEDVVA